MAALAPLAPLATLAGIPLLDQQVGWMLTAGVQPYRRVFEMDALMARALDPGAAEDPGGLRTEPRDRPGSADPRGGSGLRGPVTLRIEAAPNHQPVVVEKLYILAILPGSRPETRYVLVADRRVLWMRKLIEASFNMRRRTGEWQLVGEARMENKQLTPVIAHKPWSLRNDSTIWTPKEALEHCLKQLVGGEYRLPPTFVRQIPLQDFDEGGPGSFVLQSLLSYLGGYDVSIDLDGTVRVVDTRDRSESAVVAIAQPIHYEEGSVEISKRAHWRPRDVTVYFDRECELRLDYAEEPATATAARFSREPLDLENVLPCPDITLAITSGGSAFGVFYGGRTVSIGTWLAFEDFFEGTKGDWAVPGVDLTHARCRYFWTMWAYAPHIFARTQGSGFSQLLVKRLNAVRKHWRQTFRINPRWLDKMRSWKANRIAVIDVANGTRAPAEVWTDYIHKPTTNVPIKRRSDNPDIGRQVTGYADLLANGKAAPVDVRVVDEDAGVFTVHFVPDLFGEGETIIPGHTAVLPSQFPSIAAERGMIAGSWTDIHLDDGWKLAIVITAIQGAPNDKGRLHSAKVTPQQAAAKLGVTVGECAGEPWEVRIGGGVLTAKFAWRDELSDQIKEAWYTGAAYPDELLSNRREVEDVAHAMAAQIYSTMLDRVEGAYATTINPAIKVTGSLSSVEHVLTPDGVGRTILTFAPEVTPLPAESFMSPATRQLLRRLVQPG